MSPATRTFEFDDVEKAAEFCHESRWTDGLPVTLPTRGAIDRIIDYLGRPSTDVIGIIPPRNGVATIEKIAINCVMAGCLPEHVPIVIAAIEAMLEERFNLNGVQTTTHCCAPFVMVSGPAVRRLGFNTKESALGHGCRASAAIGRAVRLILWNGGGGYPGEPCKTTHGHPGYFSYCGAEDQDSNPWDPMHVEYGYQPDDTVVTVLAAQAPNLLGTGAGYAPAEDVLYVLADSIASLGSPNVTGGDMALVLGPMAAKNLSSAGLSRAQVRESLMRLATRSVADMKRRRSISEQHPMHWKQVADENNDALQVPFIREPGNLVIMVTGGWGSGGAFCSICPGWGAPGGYVVHRKVSFPGT